MQFELNVQDLLDGLNTVTRALAVRPAKQVLEGVLIEAVDDTVTLTGSDGNLSIQAEISASILEGGRAVMPGRLFTELVRKLPGGTVKVSVNDHYAAKIVCQSSRFSLTGMSGADYPEMAEVNAVAAVNIPQNKLRDMISRVVFAIATDETRQILTGCLLEVTCEEARLVALDGYRLALQKLQHTFAMPEGRDVVKAVIPGRVLNEMSKVLPDEETDCVLRFDGSRMEASFGNIRLNTVLLAGEFIDYRKILPTAFKTEARCDRSQVANAIDRCSLMAREGKNNLIRMEFTTEESKLIVSSNADMGDAVEEMNVLLSGDSLRIAFNAKYITDVIRNISEDELTMKFNSNVSPCIFVPKEGDDFLYLILPVRVFQ